MFENVLGKKKYIPLTPSSKADPSALSGNQKTCPVCIRLKSGQQSFAAERVCPACKYHFPMSAWERIDHLTDPQSFEELDKDLVSINILDFPGYDEKLKAAAKNSGLKEAIICGKAMIGGYQTILAVMDSSFMMGSMGSVVGEKVCRAAEKAMELRIPLIIITASGGARMQEGMISLMQMAKTSAVLKKFHQSGLLYISILTNPTTGGVSASFASLADIIIAEPGALVGFTGPRVIAQTMGQKLPAGFQCSEFLLEHGQADLIAERSELKHILQCILKLYQGGSHA
ncbi:MAG: acetyl-CoA carboxylase, carboxyltransferase subunit beta [Syntrophomonadaceae bacterium]|jgi:acetyl-CoA carboxylase carboxyl transferase subunit beta|nr:acetyl-CoA carboxylase, carboxyltransferase subunit beta [Syntrophomonadaceae bacterium]